MSAERPLQQPKVGTYTDDEFIQWLEIWGYLDDPGSIYVGQFWATVMAYEFPCKESYKVSSCPTENSSPTTSFTTVTKRFNTHNGDAYVEVALVLLFKHQGVRIPDIVSLENISSELNVYFTELPKVYAATIHNLSIEFFVWDVKKKHLKMFAGRTGSYFAKLECVSVSAMLNSIKEEFESFAQ